MFAILYSLVWLLVGDERVESDKHGSKLFPNTNYGVYVFTLDRVQIVARGI